MLERNAKKKEKNGSAGHFQDFQDLDFGPIDRCHQIQLRSS